MTPTEQQIEQLKAEASQLNRQLRTLPASDVKSKVALMKAIHKIDMELADLRAQQKTAQTPQDDKPVPEIGVQEIEAILKYLPIFEQQNYQFGQWIQKRGQFAYFAYSPEVLEFQSALYRHNIIIVFDWTIWDDEAKRYQAEPKALETADLLTLRKLLTAHIRADRFVEGHLASVLESGHIAAILRRLRQIREEMIGDTQ